MLKKITAQFLVTALVLLLTCSDLFAQTETRVRFRKGRTSTTVTGRIAGGAFRVFVLSARAGQSLSATVSSRSGNVIMEGYYPETTSLNLKTIRGDNHVTIENTGNSATTFTLTISIR